MVPAGLDVFHVGLNHVGQEAFVAVVPVVPDGRRAVLDPAEGRLALDEETQLVAGVKKLLRRRVVRRADVVAVSGLEEFGILPAQLRRAAPPAQRMHLVAVHAVQLDRTAVHQQPVPLHLDLPHPYALFVGLHLPAVDGEGRGQRIKLRRLRIPEPGVPHGQRSRDRPVGR